MLPLSRRQAGLLLLSTLGSFTASGCGTILYPERRGQPKGRLDWGIVALDGLGLLLFFVPGVIAFAVDFSTGAIYLPPEPYYGSSVAPSRDRPELMTRQLPPDELTDARIADVVSEHVGQPIHLDRADCQRVKLSRLDDFWATSDRLVAAASARSIERQIQRAQSMEQQP